MARIRSIHPGLFTDEAFVSASMPARQLLLGLWCEAWDDGVVRWKPLTLKMRIFPADAVEVSDLLDELATLDIVKSFEVDGKRYGAIRNFRRFQKPKKPNSSGVLPAELRSYVGLAADDPETVPNRSITVSEKSDQMEDGGWKREDGERTVLSVPAEAPEADPPPDADRKRNSYPDAFELLWDQFPTNPNASKKTAYEAWQKLGPPERDECLTGAGLYAIELENQRRNRPRDPPPVLHLVNFIKQRRFETLLENERQITDAAE